MASLRENHSWIAPDAGLNCRSRAKGSVQVEANAKQADISPEPQCSSRSKWKYADKATEFHRRNNYPRYTMDLNSTLEAEMRDPELSKEHRILAAIKRYSWGYL